MTKGKLIVISGCSGVGKNTVLGIMMNKRTDLSFSVSATTRAPRPNEVDGVHYYFITREHFEDMIAKGEFLEYDAHNNYYYGTPRAQAEQKREQAHVLLDIEPKGAAQVRQAEPDATLIFIMPPSMEELERRLADCDKKITVAVMGCVVNGPGEAAGADIGVAGGRGEGLLFRKGEILYKVPQEKLLDALLDEIAKL